MIRIVHDPGFGICFVGKEYVGSYYLMHHRVGGEKKGVRRWQNKDGSYTPEGYLHYKEMYGWGDRQKGSVVSKEARRRMNAEHGYIYDGFPEETKTSLSKVQIPVESISNLKRIPADANIYAIRRNINHPDEDLGDVGREFNCPNCACTFEMTERGYDVIARRTPDGSNVGNIDKFFKGGKLLSVGATDWNDNPIRLESRPREKRQQREYDRKLRQYYNDLSQARTEAIEDLRNEMRSQGDGARGIIVVGWLMDHSIKPTTAFHALNYKVEDGTPTLYDTQSFRKCTGTKDFGSLYGCDPRELYIMRTDLLEVDESITQILYSNGRGK